MNDYNRSRSYLADLANRDGVPVLDDIEEAVNCTVRRLKEIREFESSGPFWNCKRFSWNGIVITSFFDFFYHFSTEKYELIFRKLYNNMIIPLICYVFHHGLLQCDGMASVQKPFVSFNPLVPIFQNIYIDCHMYIGNKINSGSSSSSSACSCNARLKFLLLNFIHFASWAIHLVASFRLIDSINFF